MRPNSWDTALFLMCMATVAFEGALIAHALVAGGYEPLSVSSQLQWFVTPVIGFGSAALVYRSAMSKIWQDRDAKLVEQEGIAAAVEAEFLDLVKATFWLGMHMDQEGAYILSDAKNRDPSERSWKELVERLDKSVEYSREQLPKTHGSRIGNLVAMRSEMVDLLSLAREMREGIDWLKSADLLEPERRVSFVKLTSKSLLKRCAQVAGRHDVDTDDWRNDYIERLKAVKAQMLEAGWKLEAQDPAPGSFGS